MEARRAPVIVVDTNLLIGAVFEASPVSLAVVKRDPVWAAPALWRSEFRSVLAALIRTQQMPGDEALRGYAEAEELVRQTFEAETPRIVKLIQPSPCTAYDLEFVALAEQLNVPLVTNDRQILKAFPGRAVTPAAFVA